jgi:hypothetical protein
MSENVSAKIEFCKIGPWNSDTYVHMYVRNQTMFATLHPSHV